MLQMKQLECIMPIIETSHKLSSDQEEYRVCSGSFVFFRVIVGENRCRLMTATASEDTGEYRAFDDQKRLLDSTLSVFADLDMESVLKEDHAGRQYLETEVFNDAKDLVHVATTVLDRLGFEDISVLALREMKAVHNEFSTDYTGEDAYLSDGMWVTADGRLVQR
ncbi:hypothetical protein CDQ91_19430 [Sphingopyxis witflariensis]|uniref:Uncharacterized protein n=2 Tax=Sphingopyxis witflariensis TaxID=173675 RepID=A0A246JF14_9SPHN|nr:hypothetical protein CDQ91_19430 [Sphingopyxis witflariensis]